MGTLLTLTIPWISPAMENNKINKEGKNALWFYLTTKEGIQ